MTDTNQPQTWHKSRADTFYDDGTTHHGDWWVVFEFAPYKGSPLVAEVPTEKLADAIIADHAAAARLAAALAEIERLKQSDEHHNQLATEYMKRRIEGLAVGCTIVTIWLFVLTLYVLLGGSLGGWR